MYIIYVLARFNKILSCLILNTVVPLDRYSKTRQFPQIFTTCLLENHCLPNEFPNLLSKPSPISLGPYQSNSILSLKRVCQSVI